LEQIQLTVLEPLRGKDIERNQGREEPRRDLHPLKDLDQKKGEKGELWKKRELWKEREIWESRESGVVVVGGTQRYSLQKK